MDRKTYVEALKVERAAAEQRGGDPAHLASIDAELDRYSDAPKRREREKRA
jgi:hypothetical protein